MEYVYIILLLILLIVIGILIFKYWPRINGGGDFVIGGNDDPPYAQYLKLPDAPKHLSLYLEHLYKLDSRTDKKVVRDAEWLRTITTRIMKRENITDIYDFISRSNIDFMCFIPEAKRKLI